MEFFDVNVKKVIVLSARQNRGKTESLNMLIDTLARIPNDFKELREDSINSCGDRFVVFKHLKSKGIVGITTGADIERSIMRNIQLIQEHFGSYAPFPYGIWITATRTRAITVTKTEAFADKNKSDLVFIRKLKKRSWETSENVANKRYCELLYQNLLACIDELS